MRIKEILPESWWKDLDPGFLGMMGYTNDEPAAETVNGNGTLQSVAQDVKSIRGVHQPKKI